MTSLDVWSEKVWELLGRPKGKLVADIGCGTGRYSFIMTRKGARVVGLDFSKGMISKGKEKDRERAISWVRADAQSLPLSDASFDGTLMFLVLQHLPNWRVALAECARVAKPGGRLVVVTTSRDRIRNHLMRHFPGAVEIDLGRFPGVSEVVGALRRLGFSNVRQERILVRRGMVSIDEMVSRYARKHISTLALIPAREFGERLQAFEMSLRHGYGTHVPDDTELIFVHACARA